MTLDELILKRFRSYASVSEKMARYAKWPAIFRELAPDDQQQGWQGKGQYPRIVFSIDLQANQERKSSGILQVDLFCAVNGIMPEDIEPAIRECLKDLLLNPDHVPYGFAWTRTDAFEIPTRENTTNTKVIGDSIRFDILEYPAQETTDPDPIVAANRYIKEKISESIVIGFDHIDEIMEANPKVPVFYCRMERISKGLETNTVAWMDGKIAVHIICPDQEIRNKYVASLMNVLSLDGEVMLLDHSPMLVKEMTMNSRADYLKDGQLSITVRYGLLRYQSKPHRITDINFS